MQRFTGGVLRHHIDEVKLLGEFVARQFMRAALFEFFGRYRLALAHHNEGGHGLPPVVIFLANDGDFTDRRVVVQHLFDFAREDILATGDDDVLFAVDEVEMPLVVDAAEVAHGAPAVHQCFGGCLGLVPVAVEQPRVLDPHLAHLANAEFFAFVVANLEPDAGARLADATVFAQLVLGPQERATARLCRAVGFKQDPVAEEIDDLHLGGLRQGRGVGVDDLQRTLVVFIQGFRAEIEQRMEVGGHHEHAGDLTLFERTEHYLWFVPRQDVGGAPEERARQGVDEPGPVVEGRGCKRARRRRVATVVGRHGEQHVIDAAAVRQEHPFGMARCARRVGHREDVPFFQGNRGLVAGRCGEKLFVVAVVITRIDHDDAVDGLQVGSEGRVLIVDMDKENFRGGVIADVGRFMRGGARIDHCGRDADLRHPAGHLNELDTIGTHQGDVIARHQAETEAGVRNPVDALDQVAMGELTTLFGERELVGVVTRAGPQAFGNGDRPEGRGAVGDGSGVVHSRLVPIWRGKWF